MLEILLRRLFNREEEAPPASSSAAQRLSHALRHNEYSVLYLFAPGALAEAEFVDACTALLGDPPVDATELSWLWKQGAHEGRLSFVHLRELCLNSDHAAPVTTFTTRSSTRGCLGCVAEKEEVHAPMPEPAVDSEKEEVHVHVPTLEHAVESAPTEQRSPSYRPPASPPPRHCASASSPTVRGPGGIDIFAGSEKVDRRQFRQAMLRLGLRAAPLEIDSLFDSIASDGQGSVPRAQLLELLRSRHPRDGGPSPSSVARKASPRASSPPLLASPQPAATSSSSGGYTGRDAEFDERARQDADASADARAAAAARVAAAARHAATSPQPLSPSPRSQQCSSGYADATEALAQSAAASAAARVAAAAARAAQIAQTPHQAGIWSSHSHGSQSRGRVPQAHATPITTPSTAIGGGTPRASSPLGHRGAGSARAGAPHAGNDAWDSARRPNMGPPHLGLPSMDSARRPAASPRHASAHHGAMSPRDSARRPAASPRRQEPPLQTPQMNSSQSKQWATPLPPAPPPSVFSVAAAFSAAEGVAQTPNAPDAPSPSLSLRELKLYADEFGNEWTEEWTEGAPAADAPPTDEAQRSTNLPNLPVSVPLRGETTTAASVAAAIMAAAPAERPKRRPSRPASEKPDREPVNTAPQPVITAPLVGLGPNGERRDFRVRSSPQRRREWTETHLSRSARLHGPPSPGPGQYNDISALHGTFAAFGKRPGDRNQSAWGASGSGRMPRIFSGDVANAPQGGPGEYEPQYPSKPVLAVSATRSPSWRSQRGNQWGARGVLDERQGVMPLREPTPGPGAYFTDESGPHPDTILASKGPTATRQGLGSVAFRSGSAQHLTHNFGISKDTPGVGAYDIEGEPCQDGFVPGVGDGITRSRSMQNLSLAPGTGFGSSRFDRFKMVHTTAAHVAPGTYRPEVGEQIARERAKSAGKAGAENFPFSSTTVRDNSIFSSAKKLAWTGSAVDDPYGMH